MKIKSVNPVGKMDVYDITVKDNNQYITENGVVNHNTGAVYAADSIFIIGKQQSKDKSNNLVGWNFILNVFKSRFIKEKMKIPITVHFEKGILKYSGLFEIAKSAGFIKQCKIGRSGGYRFTLEGDDNAEDKVWETLTADVLSNDEFWEAVLSHTNLKEVIEALYKIPTNLTSADEQILKDNKDIVESIESEVSEE